MTCDPFWETNTSEDKKFMMPLKPYFVRARKINDYFNHPAHISGNTEGEGGVAMERPVKLEALGILWSHMDKLQKDKLHNLTDYSLDCLHTLFCEKMEFVLPEDVYDIDEAKSDYDPIKKKYITEDVHIELGEGSVLLVRVCSVVEKKAHEEIYQKKLLRSIPQFAWVFDDYSDSRHGEFDEKMAEIFYDYIFMQIKF